MRNIITFLLILGIAGFGFSETDTDMNGRHHDHEDGEHMHNELNIELEAIWDQVGDRKIGDLTFNEVEDLFGQLSVVQQKSAYIKKSAYKSFMIPGLGQFMNGEPLSGALYLTADLAIAAGTLVGVHFLLPNEVRAGVVDYLNATHDEIKTLWQSQTFMDLWPAAAVITGGSLLQGVLRIFASKNAAMLARHNIADGKVTFEPHINMMGLGMHMRY